jgi:hypothetical protein
VEVLQGGPDAELEQALIAFWTGLGALDEAAARARLAEVLCVVYGPDDAVVGVNSAFAGTAPLIDRPLWLYRRLLLPDVPPVVDGLMLKAAYDELARRYVATRGEPIGVCAVISDSARIARDREAVWPNGFVYSGYTDAGEQVRVAYFVGARV